MTCGTSAMGYKRYCCDNKSCTHSKVICFSCKSRFCNSCGQKATEQWITQQGEILPDCQYRHLTFTMPDVFWEVFKLNRQLLNSLFSIAANTLLYFSKKKKLTIGMFVALHTYGRQLNFNCHIHLSLAATALNEHGDLKTFNFPFKSLMGMWRYGIITLLRQNFDLLILPEYLSDEIKGYQDWTRYLDGQYIRTWQVHIAKKTSHKKHTQNYLGSYLKKPPIAASRLKAFHNEDITIEYHDHRDNRKKALVLSQKELLLRLLSHIPEKFFKMIRYFGYLSNRRRGELLPKVHRQLGQRIAVLTRLSYAAMMKGLLRVDPFKCILCGGRVVFNHFEAGMGLRKLVLNVKMLVLQKQI